ncbi:hypothetical protein V6N11_044792 [Hibiscus sabdariffa]|uniref:Uncharacterized protein n=1 Tax=Hibiscus sabdariffa TaxID=183260 RepID=A0ABR2PTX8_9ROSI
MTEGLGHARRKTLSTTELLARWVDVGNDPKSQQTKGCQARRFVWGRRCTSSVDSEVDRSWWPGGVRESGFSGNFSQTFDKKMGQWG